MTEKKLPSSWDLQSEKLYANCRIFEVRERRFKRRSDGLEGDFYVLDTNDWVNVLAITPEQKIVLVRQFRFGSRENSLEPPGGVVEKGEDPIIAGIRELEEETGIADVALLDGFEERTEYSFRHKGKRKEKQVYWYIAETDVIEVQLSHEHRGYLWLDWDQALETITHDETRTVVRAAQRFVELNGRQ